MLIGHDAPHRRFTLVHACCRGGGRRSVGVGEEVARILVRRGLTITAIYRHTQRLLVETTALMAITPC